MKERAEQVVRMAREVSRRVNVASGEDAMIAHDLTTEEEFALEQWDKLMEEQHQLDNWYA